MWFSSCGRINTSSKKAKQTKSLQLSLGSYKEDKMKNTESPNVLVKPSYIILYLYHENINIMYIK